jgi:hypothetical protein
MSTTFAQLPKINSNFAKLPNLSAIKPIKPAFTTMPKLSNAFTQLPKINSNFAKLPNLNAIKPIKPAFTQMPKINSVLAKLPTMKPAFTQMPKMSSGFAQLPKINSNFVKLPNLNAIKPIKPAFTQLPKINSGLNLKAAKPVFAKIEPFKAGGNVFSKNAFKFTNVPNISTTKFTPYSFKVAKIQPIKMHTMDIPKVKFSYTQLESLNAPATKMEPVKALNSGQLMAQASLVNGLVAQPLVQDNKVKTLALLSKDMPKTDGVEVITPMEIRAPASALALIGEKEAIVVKAIPATRVEALTGYISSVNANAQLQNLAKRAITPENVVGLLQNIAKADSLKVNLQYKNPVEGLLQAVTMRER